MSDIFEEDIDENENLSSLEDDGENGREEDYVFDSPLCVLKLDYSCETVYARNEKKIDVRVGSLDSDIKNEQPNAVLELLKEHPDIKAVFCNGGKAQAAFKRYFAKKLSAKINVYYFHSTSPANARMCLDDLVQEWQAIKQYLE